MGASPEARGLAAQHRQEQTCPFPRDGSNRPWALILRSQPTAGDRADSGAGRPKPGRQAPLREAWISCQLPEPQFLHLSELAQAQGSGNSQRVWDSLCRLIESGTLVHLLIHCLPLCHNLGTWDRRQALCPPPPHRRFWWAGRPGRQKEPPRDGNFGDGWNRRRLHSKLPSLSHPPLRAQAREPRGGVGTCPSWGHLCTVLRSSSGSAQYKSMEYEGCPLSTGA